jgi:C4-dicarboxylate-specific signal transduction histidine kinase
MDIDEMRAAGIEWDDFPPGDPVFDFLMLVQSQRAAQLRLEGALARMDLEHRVSQILFQITRKTAEIPDTEDACQTAIRGVCEDLGWDFGLLYRISSTDHSVGGADPSLVLVARDAPDQDRCAEKIRRVAEGEFETGEPLVNRAAREQQLLFGSIQVDGVQWTRVAVPVPFEGEPFAVIEFFTEGKVQPPESLVRLFKSLGILLGNVVERQKAQAREREHWESLLTASKMASLGEIAASVAHEINNPLAMIAMVGQSLARNLSRNQDDGSEVDESTAKQVARINLCVQRIMTIVTGLSDFSRNSSEDPYLPHPLGPMIEETVDLCRARFSQSGVELQLKSAVPEVSVICRPSQILQVLLNLLNNAFDAVQCLDERWVELGVGVFDSEVEISVTDSGHGIPQEIVQNLMKPFFTTKAAGKGTGLGLSICSRIVADHRGSLNLDMECANTRFLLRLPVEVGKSVPGYS